MPLFLPAPRRTSTRSLSLLPAPRRTPVVARLPHLRRLSPAFAGTPGLRPQSLSLSLARTRSARSCPTGPASPHLRPHRQSPPLKRLTRQSATSCAGSPQRSTTAAWHARHSSRSRTSDCASLRRSTSTATWPQGSRAGAPRFATFANSWRRSSLSSSAWSPALRALRALPSHSFRPSTALQHPPLFSTQLFSNRQLTLYGWHRCPLGLRLTHSLWLVSSLFGTSALRHLRRSHASACTSVLGRLQRWGPLGTSMGCPGWAGLVGGVVEMAPSAVAEASP